MDSIIRLLRDPSWWFTAVFIGILARLVARYFRDNISSVAARSSQAWPTRREARLARMAIRRLAFASVALVFNLSVTQQAEAVSFTNTGSMNTARYHHTATLLPNGNVLVAGGSINAIGDPTNRPEIYNPTSGTWTITGSMTTNREYHTATLLHNGKVLVAGGFAGTYNSNRVWLNSAELYDPATGTWTATGTMTTNREFHTATLLPNGKVLIAGGFSGSGGYFSSAELYDPFTEAWTATGAMTVERYIHTATLLPDGKVLVAGGGANGSYLSSAELYDLSSGTWTNTDSLANARNAHTATLLPNGNVLVAGGYDGGSSLATAELYNPSDGTWTNTGPLNTANRGPNATLLANGKILVEGGYGGGNLNSAELYDPANGTWTETGALNVGRYFHTATLLSNGNVLVAGGYISANGATNSAELYGSSNVTVTAIRLTNATSLPSGAFQFTFTNTPDMSFIVYSTTNLSAPFSNWIVLFGPKEVSPGQYQFTDPQATNCSQRFYRIRSP